MQILDAHGNNLEPGDKVRYKSKITGGWQWKECHIAEVLVTWLNQKQEVQYRIKTSLGTTIYKTSNLEKI